MDFNKRGIDANQRALPGVGLLVDDWTGEGVGWSRGRRLSRQGRCRLSAGAPRAVRWGEKRGRGVKRSAADFGLSFVPAGTRGIGSNAANNSVPCWICTRHQVFLGVFQHVAPFARRRAGLEVFLPGDKTAQE